MQVLIVEDQANDLRIATAAATESGFTEVQARSSAATAREYLEKAVGGEHPLPDVIVLDLDLGYESGFELLRYWHGNGEVAKVPVVVWTILGEQYREICAMFKVTAYVDKGAGGAALRNALTGLARKAS